MGEFVTTLAGAKYRQKEIEQAIDWMSDGAVSVFLEPEPDNPHDPNAIRVDVARESDKSNRLTIGYLPAHIAASLRPSVDDVRVKGVKVKAPSEAFDFWNLAFTFNDGGQTVFLDDDEPELEIPASPAKRAKREPIGCGGAILIIGALLLLVNQLPRSTGTSSSGPSADELRRIAERAEQTQTNDGKAWATLRVTSNIRRGPGTEHPVVKVINEGERYRCYRPAPSDTWVKCFDGQYIHRDLVTFE